jgi:RNA polymerase sigma-70 factor (ECF subfamily)
MDTDDDNKLIAQILSGDQQAYAYLVDKYKGPIYNLVYRMTGHHQETDDLAQEIFIRTFAALKKYDINRNFFPWLYSIALNVLRNYKKKRKPMQIAPEKAIFRNREVAEPHNPEVIVDQMEQSRHLAAKIQTLPDRQREAVVLRYYQDLAFKDIAKILDISGRSAEIGRGKLMPSDQSSDNSRRKKNDSGHSTPRLPDNFESQERFKHIIPLLKNASQLPVPHNFTANVMDRLTVRKRLSPYVRMLEGFGKINIRMWTDVADATECALCFYLAGFFYFILSMVLIIGLKALGTQAPLAVWIIIQPQLALLNALGFAALGIILAKKSASAIRIAQAGTIIYIGFTVFNGLGIQKTPGNPFNTAGLLCFVGGALLLGVFLLVVLQKYQTKWTGQQVKYNH